MVIHLQIFFDFSFQRGTQNLRDFLKKLGCSHWENLAVLIGIAAIYPTTIFNLVAFKFRLKPFDRHIQKLTWVAPKNETPKSRNLRSKYLIKVTSTQFSHGTFTFFVKICQVLVTEGREYRSLQFREFHFTLAWIYDAWN